MELHERLKSAREQAGFDTASDAARQFGWPIVTYRHHENGTRGFKRDAAMRYARAFKVSPEWLLFGGDAGKRRIAPLVGFVGDRGVVIPVERFDPNRGEELPKNYGDRPFSLIVRGDGMWPRYSDGDVIFYSRPAKRNNPIEGAECVVMLSDENLFLKIVRENPDGGFDLESWNSPPIRGAKLKWLAPVFWVRRSEPK